MEKRGQQIYPCLLTFRGVAQYPADCGSIVGPPAPVTDGAPGMVDAHLHLPLCRCTGVQQPHLSVHTGRGYGKNNTSGTVLSLAVLADGGWGWGLVGTHSSRSVLRLPRAHSRGVQGRWPGSPAASPLCPRSSAGPGGCGRSPARRAACALL